MGDGVTNGIPSLDFTKTPGVVSMVSCLSEVGPFLCLIQCLLRRSSTRVSVCDRAEICFENFTDVTSIHSGTGVWLGQPTDSRGPAGIKKTGKNGLP